MEIKTKKCPVCGKSVYLHAILCPYCKAETGFVSVDEILALQQTDISQETTIEEEPVTQQASPLSQTVEDTSVVDNSLVTVEDNLSEAIDTEDTEESVSWRQRIAAILKKDTNFVREEFNDKIGRKYSRSTLLIGSVIALLSLIVLGIFIAVQFQNHKVYSTDSTIESWAKQVLDSMDQEVSLRGTTVAKFPDRQRHYMLYLQDKYLHLFDAKQRTDIIFDFEEANARAIVDYNSSGVLNAYLSPNGKYVIVIASRAEGNAECGLYRIDTENKGVQYIDRGRVTLDKEGYQVMSYNRVARYDANGDHLTGMSGDEAQRVMQQRQQKQQRPTEADEGGKEVTAPAPSVTQQMAPQVDLTPKPKVPEKITINPVE